LRVGPQRLLWTGVGAAVVLIVALMGWPNRAEPPAPVDVPPADDRTVIAEIVTPPAPVAPRPRPRRTLARASVADAGSTYVMQPAVSRRTLFTGTLQVASEPAGAEVWIDGTLVGTTPVRVERVAAGSHAVLLTHPGYQRWTSAARVVSGSPNRLLAVLDPVTTASPVTCIHGHAAPANPCETFDRIGPAATTGVEGEHPEP
jgi:hypothetical protein